ncbi:hypothetical protein DPMN_012409 [Dreissena polymorpha]|uniref:Uncharacterized protein n=1 Tax=Dreissena polymorpha TaxID=45954 RepID=A0A9D4S1B8_DREPO|nr:hypothetical protein DPMN_012409 [Dreissena polymorpha]
MAETENFGNVTLDDIMRAIKQTVQDAINNAISTQMQTMIATIITGNENLKLKNENRILNDALDATRASSAFRRAKSTAHTEQENQAKVVILTTEPQDTRTRRAQLLYVARGLAKSKKIEAAWSADGTVLIRVIENGEPKIKRITCEIELDNYK